MSSLLPSPFLEFHSLEQLPQIQSKNTSQDEVFLLKVFFDQSIEFFATVEFVKELFKTCGAW